MPRLQRLAPRAPLVLVALAALAVAPADPRAASPGLPFTENFADDSLKDPAKTTAAWTPSGAAFAPRQRLYSVFGPPMFGTDISLDLSSAQFVSAALGDVDGDGDLDLVLGNWGTPNRLYLNNGTAAPFSGITGTSITADNPSTTSVALGDLDGDGDLDLVAGIAGSPNRLYLNNGTATPFSGISGADIGTGNQETYSVALGDVDGDGDLDLVAGSLGSPNRLYLNNGTAAPFNGVAGTNITADSLPTKGVALGDLDGDGDLDLVTGVAGSPNRLYLNNGTAAPWSGVAGSDISADNLPTSSVALGDMDGDGDLDVVTTNDVTRTRLYLNNGTASPFSGVTGSDITADVMHGSAALGDLDRDGDLDVVVSNVDARNRAYFNNGTATPFSGVTGLDISAETPMTQVVVLGDLDGDSDLDLVAAARGSYSRLFLNNGQPNPLEASDVATYDLSNLWLAVALGDMDGDGDLDLVVGNSNQTNRLYLNNGTSHPFFTITGSDITTDVLGTHSLAVGDVDGDGDLDLVTGNFEAASRLYLNNGTANPFAGVTGSAIGGLLPDTIDVALGDMDGDGDLDLVIGNNSGPNRLYLNNGTASPFSGVAGSDITPDDYSTESLAVGDVDGDGDLDVATGSFSSGYTNRLYLNNGTANPFLGVTGVDITSDSQGGAQSVALADVDRDGDLDFVVGETQVSPPRLYLNNGTASPFAGVTGSTIGSTIYSTNSIALGDVDNDGDADLVVGNSGQSRLFLNNGTASPFAGVTGLPLGVTGIWTLSTALGDVDGDGDLDYVQGNFQQPHRLYFSSAGPTPINTFHRDDIGADANASWCAALGDVDADGDLDLVVGSVGQPIRLYVDNGTADPWAGVSGVDVTSDANSTASVALADVDGDGDLDLVAGNVNSPNRLYLNNGTADPFGGVTGTDITPDVRITRAVALVDMDGDGDLDLVAANQNTTARLYLNNGTANPFAGVTGSDITAYTADTITMTVGDVDGDGDLDVVTGSISRPVRLSLNNGTAAPFNGVAGSDVSTDATMSWSVALGDMDGDGDLDIVAEKPDTPSRLYANNGTANPFAGVTGSNISADVLSVGGMALSDIDADGDLDVVVGNDPQPTRVYLNNGTANPFAGATSIYVNSDGGATRALVMGDVDRDGSPDIVAVMLYEPTRLYRAVKGHAPLGRAVSLAVDGTPADVMGATLSAVTPLPPNTGIDFWLSNNGGARWYQMHPGKVFVFTDAGSDLRWRAELRSLSPVRSPLLNMVHLDQAWTAGDRVWQDIDGNGIQGAGELGAPGVLVILYTPGGAVLETTLTDANGYYRLHTPINPGSQFRLRFIPLDDQVLTLADQGGDDTLDSDADQVSGHTYINVFTGDIDQARWDAGIYPACMPPDTPVVISNIGRSVPDGYSILSFTDGNWLSRVTGYNVRRSTDASLPRPSWPLLAGNIDDQDLATPGKQWTDTSGNPPLGAVWFYEVAAYNIRCPAEGPY